MSWLITTAATTRVATAGPMPGTSRWIRAAGLDSSDITGITYNPLSGVYKLDPRDVDVNYMVASVRPE